MVQRKIKIALMSYSMDNRPAKGTALYTRKLIEHMLDDSRFEFTLVHFEHVNDPLYTKVREIIMPDIRLPMGTQFARTLLFFWRYRNEGFDVMHWFQGRLYPFFWLAPAKHIVVTAHGAGDASLKHSFVASRAMFVKVMQYAGRFIDAVIGSSEFGRREIIEHFYIRPDRAFAIPLGGGEDFLDLDPEIARRTIAQKYGVRKPYVLDVSRLMPHKNVDTVIRAYIRMRERYHSRNEALVIVGWPVSDSTETYSLARSSAFADDIHFIDFVEEKDLNAMYAGAGVFVFPSLNEGFGLPVVEAFASGTPVITSNVTSLPEIGGDAAWCIDPKNIEELSIALNTVLSDPARRSAMIRKGLERAKLFTWQRTARETTSLYETLVKNDAS